MLISQSISTNCVRMSIGSCVRMSIYPGDEACADERSRRCSQYPPCLDIHVLQRDVAAGNHVNAGAAYACAVAGDQGLTLVHFSAQSMYFCGIRWVEIVTETAHIQLLNVDKCKPLPLTTQSVRLTSDLSETKMPAPNCKALLFANVQPVKSARAPVLTATPAAPFPGLLLSEKEQFVALAVPLS